MEAPHSSSDALPAAARSWIQDRLGSRIDRSQSLPGGAGSRRYVRAWLTDGRSVVWMHALPEEEAILPPGLRRPSTSAPFLTVTRLLAQHSLPVPEIVATHPHERWILLEDLGSCHLCDLHGSRRVHYHREAIELLARVHSLPLGTGLPFDRVFDEEWILFELSHFLEHAAPADDRDTLTRGFQALARQIATLPRVLCLRDYQSQNLMIDAKGALRILDYQDALLAPAELDLAALLHDSYLEIPTAERGALLERYGELRERRVDTAQLATLIVQRKCKDLGRFRYLCNVKQDSRFAPFQAAARRAVLEASVQLPETLAALGEDLREALGGERS